MAVTIHSSSMHAAPTTFIDVEGEIEFWRRGYRDHPAFSANWSFAVYEFAVRVGIGAFIEDSARTFEECRDSLEEVYQTRGGSAQMDWTEAGSAAAAAWHRLARRHRVAAANATQAIPATSSGIASALEPSIRTTL